LLLPSAATARRCERITADLFERGAPAAALAG
jgi:hypothetical protein